MNKIDTSNWGEFKLSDLFEIKGSTTTPKIELEFNDEERYPYITTAATNNGVLGYSNIFTENGNVLTVDSAVLGSTFYQKENFTASDHVEKLEPKFKMTKNIALFIVCIMNRNSEILGYAYNQKRSQKALKEEKIYLPINSIGEPDFEYMDSYIQSLDVVISASLTTLLSAKEKKEKINTEEWKEFIIKDLFIIKRPIARSQSNYNDGDVPFVASGNFNNGVLKYLEPKQGEILDKGNCITVSPVDGSCFYQENDFLGRGGAGSSIILLYNQNLNKNNGHFISSIIQKVCEKYTYGDMANKETISEEKIKLPVKPDGTPNYDFMDKIMEKISIGGGYKLRTLQEIL